MKISSVFCISAIATSTLITFSTAALAISQPKNITTNLELQSLQISELSTQKNNNVSAKAEKEEEEEQTTAGRCDPSHPLFPFCGWW
ncbi:hypothetical protein [Pseudanabaena sp. BC1403]|uniref:hypothetical protein n=1 Tax=Pseudanabaena sp. BC1403 TaxID=2043171 RepID=UPI000CD87E8E|nr:hypothetical protein [Pseudanabaena sp. BC1403]